MHIYFFTPKLLKVKFSKAFSLRNSTFSIFDFGLPLYRSQSFLQATINIKPYDMKKSYIAFRDITLFLLCHCFPLRFLLLFPVLCYGTIL